MATKIRGRQIETDDFIKSVRNSDLDWTNDVNTASQKAIAQYVASAAGGGDVLVCTFNRANNTMDKTPQEIYEAYQADKFIICVDTPYYLKLTYITPQSSSYLIHFESIHLAGYGNYEIRYISYNTSTWLSSTDSIQQGLVSGTNIKTINGNSVLGSGNINTESWSVESIADGTTTKTIVPTTIHSHIFIDNSSNTDDLNVTIDNTGIDTVLCEYETLIVKASTKVRFDIMKFTQSNTVYVSVKRSNLIQP